MQHWLPYDEPRLYALLGADRGTIRRELRDDTRNLAQLAQQRGWEPRALARELVAPWRGAAARPRPPCAARAARAADADAGPPLPAPVLPLAAPGGDPRRTRRRSSASRAARSGRRCGAPSSARCRSAASTACRAGTRRSRRGDAARVRRPRASRASRSRRRRPSGCSRASCASSRAGCNRRATTGRRRSSSPRSSPATASNYSNNAALSADGREIVFESYQAKLAIAKRRGEIAVMARRAAPPRRCSRAARRPTRARTTTRRSRPTGAGSRSSPRSATSTSPSATAACRSSRATCAAAARSRSPHPPDLRSRARPTTRRSRATAGSSPTRPTTGPTSRAAARASSCTTCAAAASARCPRRAAWPATSTSRGCRPTGGGSPSARSPRRRHALGGVRARPAQRAHASCVGARREEAWEPVLSARGSVVAYTAAGAGGESHVVVRDLARGGAPDRLAGRFGLAFEPSLSGSGRRVAFVARPGGTRQTQVFVRDLRAARRSSSRAPTARRAARAWAAPATPRSPATGAASRSPPRPGTCRRTSATARAAIFVRDLARTTTRGPARATGEPLPRPDEGLELARGYLRDLPLRVTAVPRDAG